MIFYGPPASLTDRSGKGVWPRSTRAPATKLEETPPRAGVSLCDVIDGARGGGWQVIAKSGLRYQRTYRIRVSADREPIVQWQRLRLPRSV